MLNRTTSEQYVDSLRCTLGRLERNGDFGDPWIAEFRRSLLERIATLGSVNGNSLTKGDSLWAFAEPMQITGSHSPNQSFREIVLLSGTLAKSGTVGNCIVRATKVTIPSLRDSEYVAVEVALAPPHLPDGQYALHFEGRRMPVRNNGGRWSTSGFCEQAPSFTVVNDGKQTTFEDGCCRPSDQQNIRIKG